MRSAVAIACVVLAGAVAPARAGDNIPVVRDAEQVASGHAIYRQYCASCHGANGEGAPAWRERDARGELPAPPHSPKGHAWRHSDAMLYRMVMQGWRDPFNKTQRLTMPAFAGVLAPSEVRSVIAHIKTLWTGEQREFQREENRRQSSAPAVR